MFQIDQYAYANRLFSAHPGEKITFSFITMIICLISPSVVTLLSVTLLMAGVVILRAGIPWKFYFKLLTVPGSFLIIGVITVAVSISGYSGGNLWGVALGRFYISVSSRDLDLAILLFFRSLGAVSCLYFLSLTTPMVEVITILRKLRVPTLFIELMGLIYRFIFVLTETAENIYTAQSSRLGYKNIKAGYRSMGSLAANLFVIAYRRSEQLFTAMTSRGYTGEIRVLEASYKVSAKNVITILVIDVLLVLLSLADGRGGGLFGRVFN